jgi:hypothetical protein
MTGIITDYEILHSDNTEDLSKKVKEKILKGWQPKGELIYTPGGFPRQVVVKYAIMWDDIDTA